MTSLSSRVFTLFLTFLFLCLPNAFADDFATRCAAPGVIKCVGFDSAAEIQGGWGDNSGSLSGAPDLDTSIKASGNSSIRFTAVGNSSSMGGDYFTNFSDDLSVQFGENSTFYIQFRQRFSDSFLATHFEPYNSWKQMIVGTGDNPNCETIGSHPNACSTSCTDLEVVLTNGDTHQPFAGIYRTCNGSTHLSKADGIVDPFESYDFLLQNARPFPHCRYLQWMTEYLPPVGNCFGYFPNEWMTFQVMIQTGPRVADEFVNSTVKLWIAREGQPSEPVIDSQGIYLGAGDPAEGQKFGKVHLLPYLTSKSDSQSHPTVHTWYDELIISHNKIADPGATTGDILPSSPTNLRQKTD